MQCKHCFSQSRSVGRFPIRTGKASWAPSSKALMLIYFSLMVRLEKISPIGAADQWRDALTMTC